MGVLDRLPRAVNYAECKGSPFSVGDSPQCESSAWAFATSLYRAAMTGLLEAARDVKVRTSLL
jgi:hypothetical protein